MAHSCKDVQVLAQHLHNFWLNCDLAIGCIQVGIVPVSLSCEAEAGRSTYSAGEMLSWELSC